MDTEKYSELVNLIQISNIQIIESNEKVLELFFSISDGEEVKLESKVGYRKDDPFFEKNRVSFISNYLFDFIKNGKIYFTANYSVLIIFSCSNLEKVKELFMDEEIKKIFMGKQMNKIVWSYLRGVLLEACNRHGMPTIPLPLLV